MLAGQKKTRTCFEVTSEVLYLDGKELHFGDVLNPVQLGARLIDLVALGMVRPIEQQGFVPYASGLNALR